MGIRGPRSVRIRMVGTGVDYTSQTLHIGRRIFKTSALMDSDLPSLSSPAGLAPQGRRRR